MKYRMPYVYKALVKPARARNWVSENFGAYVEIDIPEASQDEAPLVVRWSQREEGYRQRYEGRVYQGRFYATVGTGDGGFLSSDAIEIGHIHDFKQIRRYNDPYPIDLFQRGMLTHVIGDYRESTQSDEEQVLAEVAESAGNILVVDGLVYKPHPIPLILAEKTHTGPYEIIDLSVTCSADNDDWYAMHFPIQQAEEARAWADAYGAATEARVTVEDKTDIEVLRPDLLTDTNYFATDLADVLARFVRDNGKELAKRPDGFIDAWQEMRRCAKALSAESDSSMVDAAMAAWGVFLERFDEFEDIKRANWDEVYDRTQHVEHQAHAFFFPRWEICEIGLDLGSTPSGPTIR